ncbi:phospholipase A2 inhibitor and Ly6/PLAUR domain-containing protein-like [Elgaria multicarinata webbii]|uniref:phospholipase A2 inhibitor and Ly6/PLAUR domain-containing protein-like n=1 Tax=Elgaria multicarinata webbii TaxID=159646 RepID=UPI002FCD2D53
METPLAICLFFAIFIARGVSLQCQTCSTAGKACDGRMETCASANDTCGIIQAELPKPTNHKIVKKCIPSNDCDKGIAIIDMGKNRIEMRKVSCCSGEDCQKKPLSWTMPTRKTTPSSAKKCPACHPEGNACKEETIECTGDGEDYCAQVYQHVTDAGGKTTTTIMKGCANEAFCNSMQTFFPTGVTQVSTDGSKEKEQQQPLFTLPLSLGSCADWAQRKTSSEWTVATAVRTM